MPLYNCLSASELHSTAGKLITLTLYCRCLSLARDYSKRRSCFGLKIAEYPLHVNTMAALELETRAGMILLLEVTR